MALRPSQYFATLATLSLFAATDSPLDCPSRENVMNNYAYYSDLAGCYGHQR
ncbi:hypothetical protein F7D08_1610 [Bifidobacterium cebidarum]|uniref:Uncharacterized protein n=1 Tax=Bifidobacterium cebidarum TaxID=2650773 RepID=A0A6I1GAR9_9BIFI|nr:hypothetical protein F7D08_1610 [Bifidobacterium cebidarum]